MPPSRPPSSGGRKCVALENALCFKVLQLQLTCQRRLQVFGRRLQTYGGQVHEKTGVLLAAALPR